MTESNKLRDPGIDRTCKIVIRPSAGWLTLNLKELWSYRELLMALAWRDVSIRYKQSIVGFGWAIIQPVMMTIIFTIIFGRFAKLPSEGIPYPLFTYCALLPWNFFVRSLNGSSNSMVGSAHLVTKVYFPRLILPLSQCVAGIVDFAVAFFILIGMMFWYEMVPNTGILLLPFFYFHHVNGFIRRRPVADRHQCQI
jgi:lipopolysaccharide transport system permease protein